MWSFESAIVVGLHQGGKALMVGCPAPRTASLECVSREELGILVLAAGSSSL